MRRAVVNDSMCDMNFNRFAKFYRISEPGEDQKNFDFQLGQKPRETTTAFQCTWYQVPVLGDLRSSFRNNHTLTRPVGY